MAPLPLMLGLLSALAVALLLVHGRLDGDGHDLRLMAWAKGLQTAGWLGFATAESLTMVLPPFRYLLLVGFGLEAMSVLRVRTGRPKGLLPGIAAVFGLHGAVALAVAGLPFEAASFAKSLVAALLFLPGSVCLLRPREEKTRRLHMVAGGAYLVVALFALARGSYLLAGRVVPGLPVLPWLDIVGSMLLQALAFVGCVWFVVVLRERYEAHIYRLATTDALTGLHNRQHFLSAATALMALAARRQGRVGVLMLDVDHFKRINDEHGHSVGDAVLRHIGAVLPNLVRRCDLTCRYGGEEFLVLLPDADDGVTELVGERIRKGMELTGLAAEEDGSAVPFTVSVGGACRVPSGEKDFDNMLVEADAALYEAKRSGRNALKLYNA